MASAPNPGGPTSADLTALAAAMQAASTSIQSFTNVVAAVGANMAQAAGSMSASRGGRGPPDLIEGAGTSIRTAGMSLLRGAGLGDAALAGLTSAQGITAVAGPVGVVVSALTQFAQGLERTTERVQGFFHALAEFSPQMGLVQFEARQREYFRQREIGDRLSGSARELMQAEQRKLDARKEIDIAIAEGEAALGVLWENVKTDFYGLITPLVQGLNQLAGGRGIHGGMDETASPDQLAEMIRGRDDQWRWRQNPNWLPVPAPAGDLRGRPPPFAPDPIPIWDKRWWFRGNPANPQVGR